MTPRTLKDRFYWYVPGGESAGILSGLYWNWAKFTTWCPLLSLTRVGWWRMVYDDYNKGFTTCSCSRTWWKYRLLPALVGSRRFGGGC